MNRVYLSADQLLADSYRLALDIVDSGFRPQLLIGIWRGGAPVAIAVHEMLCYLGFGCDHMPVRTSSYDGIGQRNREVKAFGMDCLPPLADCGRILLVDDVFDTGCSLQHIVDELHKRHGNQSVDIRIATPWYKPDNNLTPLTPDFYLQQTADWLVFPHELDGLAADEAIANKPALAPLAGRLRAALAAAGK